MGIKGLMKLLDEEAPGSYKEEEKKAYFGRTIAIDASMQLYQFMVAVRSDGGNSAAQLLTNEEGEVTSHLQGFLTRTTVLLEQGIKPVYVFDGAPPTLKGGELAKRREAKAKAEEELREAETKLKEAEGDEAMQAAAQDVNRLSKRTVHVTKEMNEDVKTLLRLMGLPVVEAPCEAESQCAELCKAGKVWGVGTEDMDALTFATPILLRRLTSPESRKEKVVEIHMGIVLGPEGLNLTMDQFIDLCILCGCDYCDSIRGIGPKSALKLIREHGNIETILKNIDTTKHAVPEMISERLDEVRDLFRNPMVKPASEFNLAFTAPNKTGMLEFLVKAKGFNEERVLKVIERLTKAKSTGGQTRLDGFFGKAAGAPQAAFAKPAAGKKTPGKAGVGAGAKRAKTG